MASNITASQTIGPFSHEGWRWAVDATAIVRSTVATIVIEGIIRDGDGAPINDAMIEAWLPHAMSAEASHPIPGFRRVPSSDDGSFRLELSQAASPSAGQPAAYITVFARGLSQHQFSAVFLEDDMGLAQSPILQQVPAERRVTLIANKAGAQRYRWDIWMQTDKETVFFDYT